MLEKVIEYINEKWGEKSPKHFERTVYWLKEIYPKADKVMEIAAYSHDIERSFQIAKRTPCVFETGDSLTVHQEEGGRIMYEFLLENGYDKDSAKRVKELISKHEVGGNEEQNFLKDADSISYLEVNAPRHATWKSKGYTKEEIKRKFDWMYNRITSPKAKEIAKPMHEKALKLLQNS